MTVSATAQVKRQLKASATVGTGTAYYPASTGVDLSIVRDQRTVAIWHTNAGDGSSTVDLSIEYSRDGTNWFNGPPTYGLDLFAQVTTVAVKVVRKLAVNANYFRVKSVVGTATSGAFDIQMTYDGGIGSYSA